MRKSFLSLLAVATMVSCTQNDTDQKIVEEGTPIMLGANALSVESSTRVPFEGAIGAANKLTALVLASTTTGDYTTKYANGAMTFADEVTAVGYLTDNTATPAPPVSFTGQAYYPADGKTVYFSALCPVTGWSTSTTTTSFTFTGCEDVMVAKQVSGSKTAAASTIPAFVFKHLLTKLNLKLVAEDAAAVAAWGKISKIELVKAQNSVQIPSKLETTLATGVAATGVNFGTNVSAFKCFGLTEAATVKTYTDVEYASQAYALTTTATYQAYTLAAPITATGTKDFTFRIYAAGAPAPGYLEVDVDLKKAGTAFTGDTQGKAFDITLKFKAKSITATASVSGWNTDNEANDDTVIE